VPRRPDSRDEFELALGEAMLALQLGNCDLVRCAARTMARLCGPALARWRSVVRTREAYGGERFNEVRKAA
jgi:hypothetical protein